MQRPEGSLNCSFSGPAPFLETEFLTGLELTDRPEGSRDHLPPPSCDETTCKHTLPHSAFFFTWGPGLQRQPLLPWQAFGYLLAPKIILFIVF